MFLESGMTVLLKTEDFGGHRRPVSFTIALELFFFGSFMFRPRPTKSDMNFTHEIMF